MLDISNLDAIFEDITPDESHPFNRVSDIINDLHAARQNVKNLEHELSNLKQKMCYELALNIRKLEPGLSISVDNQSCKIGYKSKLLLVVPDIENTTWDVRSKNNRFLKEFIKHNRRSMLMTTDTSSFAGVIVSHFVKYFRTLNEEIKDTGVTMVEGKHVTLVNFIKWGKALHK